MQVINSVRRFEITFWTFAIPLMKNQRFVRGAIIASVAGIILSLLGIASLIINRDPLPNPQNLPVPASQPQAVVAVPTQEQRNVLVILVDSLSTGEPRLEGLWLVGKLASNPRLVFFPIFPTANDGDPQGWAEKFSLDSEGRPGVTFIDLLKASNIYWDNYLVVDHTSLAELIELSGRIDWDGKQLSGPDVVAKIPLAQLEPKGALRAQAFIAQALCRNTAALLKGADPALLWGLLTHRMRSDLALTSVQAASNDINLTVGGPACEFPTFQEITLLNGTN